MKVVRVLVYEGRREWIDQVLRDSVLKGEGDQLRTSFGDRLKEIVRISDARIGGKEVQAAARGE